MQCNCYASLLFFFFWTGFPFEYTFPFSLANVNKLTCYKQIYLYFGGRQFLCLCKELYWCPPMEELYSLLLGWYHPLCNFLSYLKKYINTVYYQDYRKAYCGSLKLNWEMFAVSLLDFKDQFRGIIDLLHVLHFLHTKGLH